MGIIFDSLKTRNLDQVYEINLNQYYQQLVGDNIENAEVRETDFSTQISSGMLHPDLNAVVQTDVSDNLDEIFENANQYFSDLELPYTWYVIPSTEAEGLQDRLKEKGLRYVGYDIIAGVELENIVRNIAAPNSLYIEAINSQEKLEKWVDLYTQSRNIKGEIVDQYKQAYEQYDFTNTKLPFRKFIGWLNGEPVACSTLVISGGIAVVYDQSVLPRYKDHGIMEAISITPLKKAREMGYKLGLVTTSVGDLKRFTSVGFTELFNIKKMVNMGPLGRRRRRRRK